MLIQPNNQLLYLKFLLTGESFATGASGYSNLARRPKKSKIEVSVRVDAALSCVVEVC